MIKILHTGDLHLGRRYSNQKPQIAEKYSDARIEALNRIIRVAEDEACDYVVVAGDLFDTKYVPAALIKQVCEILGTCVCPVVVLPGNHDFYEGKDDKIWRGFMENASGNTTLFTSNEPVRMDGIVFYPCICFDKYSEENVIGWVQENTERADNMIHVGVAHGAIEGLSYDKEKKYYYMTQSELEQSNMDLWLIGHTHIPYPAADVIENQKIFNAGTHQQTDIADNSEGSVFIIEINGDKKIIAKKVHTGVLRFCKRNLHLMHGQSLKAEIESALSDLDAESASVRLQITGVALAEDYEARSDIYRGFEDCFVKFEPLDADLQPEITEEMIDSETIDGSVENQLLKKYIGEPELLNLAYDLVKRCKGE